jgi:hypothetical protein
MLWLLHSGNELTLVSYPDIVPSNSRMGIAIILVNIME